MGEKKIILVTGGNAGIGYDTCAVLAKASADYHVILAARSSEKGAKALEDIKAQNPTGSLSFVKLDVSSDESIASAASKITEKFGRLDVLVNNAGIALPEDQITRQALTTEFDTNVFGVILLTKALEPLLQKSADPRIINVSSIMGSLHVRLNDEAGMAATMSAIMYRSTKAALNAATLDMGRAYRDWEHPAKVWAYCPGYVATNLSGDKEQRLKAGAESAETSALGILDIVQGKRDSETNVLVTKRGGVLPW
ncbi:Short-chain dehydrogenase/reductase tropE [Paramyrothecium foliicola]|nr:Short-chain dehydrogenase/reductase tropE [Paramyrothecium foliicola]